MNNLLSEILNVIWTEIQQGISTPGHPFKNMFISSYGNNEIDTCTVVMRLVDKTHNRIYCYTDLRSVKVNNLKYNNKISILFYSDQNKIQLIIKGTATISNQEVINLEHWSNLSDQAKRSYMAQPAPSSKINAPADGLEYINEGNLQDSLTKAYQNFTVITISATFMEYLKLNRTGHRRASFQLNNNDWEGQWLIP